MMKYPLSRFRFLPAVAGILLLALLSFAGTASANGIPAAFQSDIVKLLELTGAEALGLQMGTAIADQIIDGLSREQPDIPSRVVEIMKDEIRQVFREEMPRYMKSVVPIYARHFTHAEVKTLINFYNTPVGKKSIQVMPQLLNECMAEGQKWGEDIGAKLAPRIEARLSREGIEMP